MLHGAAYGQFLFEPGDIHRTGGSEEGQVSSVNWGMLMARRPAGSGRVGFQAMLSVEPWTVGNCGFIDLLASGEICEGDTIHDRQHPHDLFMELSAEYDRPFRGMLRWQIHGGLVGEPALGPVGFPHRVSAVTNPVAPISHHWLDSTHITAGLVTTGLNGNSWKAEVSIFNGREPDENRADLDFAPLDSYSGRITFLPTPRLSIQVSAGHLEEAEFEFPPEPRANVNRLTTSMTYHRVVGESVWATTLAYGVNSEHETTSAFLAESTVIRRDRHVWSGRVEVVEKPAHDLHFHEFPERVFTVGKLQAGYTRLLAPRSGIVLGMGGFASASLVPQELTNRYVRRVVPGFGVFLTLRPGAVRHDAGSTPAVDHSQHVMPPPAQPKPTPTTRPESTAPEAPPAAEPRLPVNEAERVIDPACAATINLVTAPRASYQGKVYYFCSTVDRDSFVKDPAAYLARRKQ